MTIDSQQAIKPENASRAPAFPIARRASRGSARWSCLVEPISNPRSLSVIPALGSDNEKLRPPISLIAARSAPFFYQSNYSNALLNLAADKLKVDPRFENIEPTRQVSDFKKGSLATEDIEDKAQGP